MKRNAFFLMIMALATMGLLAFVATPQQGQKAGEPWDIPEEYKNMDNPYADDASLDRLGRGNYARHCRSCHGRNGEGDGPMAAQLNTFPGDFTDSEWQKKYNDGEIYYMSIIGRDEMPNFESTIPDKEERWAIVNHIRSLEK